MNAVRLVAVLTVLFMWGCGVEWFPDDTTTNGGGFPNNSTATTATQYNNLSTSFRNLSSASLPVSDSTGTVTVKSIVAKETSRPATDVEFTLYVDVSNAGSTAASVEIEVVAVDKNGDAVSGGTATSLITGSRKTVGYTGLKLTTAEWNSIYRWIAIKVTKK